MITYESLRELAQVLSKVTGYRYVAFSDSLYDGLFIHLSDSKMLWYSSKLEGTSGGFWINESNHQALEVKDLPFLDYSKCQFDCKEADNEQKV